MGNPVRAVTRMNLLGMEAEMNQPSLRNVLSKFRFPRPGLKAAIFGTGALVAIAVPLVALAHEAHRVAAPAAQSAREVAFLKENEAAMIKMMNNMAAPPSGDVDRDFAAMMIPHHQGAI